MGIWLILTIWILMTGVFVLAICSAAARPVPQPDNKNVGGLNRSNCEIKMKKPRANTLHPVLWLAIVLAIFATSCASNSNHPVAQTMAGR